MNKSRKNMPDIGLLIKNISERLEKNLNTELAELGVTASQLRVIYYISVDGKKDSATQKQIEKYLGVSHPTVNGIVGRLAEKGLVEVEMSVEKRIQKIVRITEKGRRLGKKIRRNQERIESKMSLGLGDGEREKLIELLEKVSLNLAQ